jgi:hypothetical protein
LPMHAVYEDASDGWVDSNGSLSFKAGANLIP